MSTADNLRDTNANPRHLFLTHSVRLRLQIRQSFNAPETKLAAFLTLSGMGNWTKSDTLADTGMTLEVSLGLVWCVVVSHPTLCTASNLGSGLVRLPRVIPGPRSLPVTLEHSHSS